MHRGRFARLTNPWHSPDEERRRFVVLLITLFVVMPGVLPAAMSNGATPLKPDLPHLTQRLELAVRPTPAATRTIADVDLLPGGRLAVLDFDTRRVAIFDSSGRFEKLLPPPPGISPETTLIPRLVALPDGGLILADDEWNRFLFYDSRLKPAAVVPMHIDTLSLNGFIRHSSGDLYIVAYAIDKDKILHRFDSRGTYIASYVDPPDLGFPERGAYSSGLVVEDPMDHTLWLTRLTPYEILHLTPDGELLGKITRGPSAGGFTPPSAQRLEGNLLQLRGYSSSVKISVIGDYVVNSYVLESGKKRADLFDRDGNVIEAGLSVTSPMAFTKRVAGRTVLRHFNGTEPRVEVWEVPK